MNYKSIFRLTIQVLVEINLYRMKTLISSINKQLFHSQYKKNTRNWWLAHNTIMESSII
jgi:hypothetical protein